MDWMSSMSNPLFWIVLAIIFSVIEVLTLGLTSLWFAAGAAIAYIAAMLGAPFIVQVVLFVASSIFFLMITKPLAKNVLKLGVERTNAESLIGEKALVIGRIEEFSTGQVKVKGQIWTALSENGEPIAVNEQVLIKSIEGVKLIVEAINKPHRPAEAQE